VTALVTGTRFIPPFTAQIAATGASISYLNYALIIPAYGVPLVGLLHVYSLYQLITGNLKQGEKYTLEMTGARN
jgi:hypothetical protein